MKTWNDYPVVLTAQETADLLRIGRLNTITEKCRTGELPAFKASGKAWRVDRDRLRLMFAPKVSENRNLSDQLGEIELALATLATMHRDEPAVSQLLLRAREAVAKAWSQTR